MVVSKEVYVKDMITNFGLLLVLVLSASAHSGDAVEPISVESLINRFSEEQDGTFAGQASERCAGILFVVGYMTGPEGEVATEAEIAIKGAQFFDITTALMRNSPYRPEAVQGRIADNASWYGKRIKKHQTMNGDSFDDYVMSDILQCRSFVKNASWLWRSADMEVLESLLNVK